MALMIRLRAAYLLTAVFVAISLTAFFLYTQDTQATNEEYANLEHLLQWRARLQQLEASNAYRSALGARFSPNASTHVQEAAHVVNGAVGNQIPGGRDLYPPANMVEQERGAGEQSEDYAYAHGYDEEEYDEDEYAEGPDSVDTADSAMPADVFGDKGRVLLSVRSEKTSEQATVETTDYSRYHNADNYYSNDSTTHRKLNYFRYIGNSRKVIQPASKSRRETFKSRWETFKSRWETLNFPQCSSDIKIKHHSNNVQDNLEEVNIVFKNLETCLASANLTHYFSEKNIRLTAMTNAANLLYMLRLVIPTKQKFDNPCWEGELEMKICQSTEGVKIEGSLHGVPFLTSSKYFRRGVKSALAYASGFSVKSQKVCLPKVFIAGFPKCGSTYVYCVITKLAGMAHHNYVLSELEKEPHFWVTNGPSKNHLYPPQIFDLASYLFNFIPAAKSRSAGHYSLPIDGSPNVMFQWPRYSGFEELENFCLIPAVLPQVLPHSKYIVIMRNPADMIYSAFWFSCSSLGIKLTEEQQMEGPFLFHEKVMKKINIFQKCSRSNPLEKCMIDIYLPIDRMFEVSQNVCGRVRLEVGFYYLYIRRWLSIVPRKKFLFLTAEELHSNEEKVTNDISNFLELEDRSTLWNEEHSPNTTYKPNAYCDNVQSSYDYHHKRSLQMLDETRNTLNDFFEIYNKKLADLLGDKKFLWQS